MNDISLNWKKISRGLPRVKKSSNDRGPTLEELRKLVEYPDRRIKRIVYSMTSGAFRLGAWDYLRWKHVSPISNDKGQVIAPKVIIYAEEGLRSRPICNLLLDVSAFKYGRKIICPSI